MNWYAAMRMSEDREREIARRIEAGRRAAAPDVSTARFRWMRRRRQGSR